MINTDINLNNSLSYLNNGSHIENEKNLSPFEIKQMKRSGKLECQTCKNRKYVDVSDDSGVSYQTPTNISPSESMSKVYSHEQEHKTRESAKAIKENKKVVSNNISVTYSRCPECGRSYVSGGVTNTITRTDSQKQKEQEYFYEKYYNDKIGKYYPQSLDLEV